MKKLLLLACLSLLSIYAMAEIRTEKDTTSCYHLDEISVISFYRTDAKVGNIVIVSTSTILLNMTEN